LFSNTWNTNVVTVKTACSQTHGTYVSATAINNKGYVFGGFYFSTKDYCTEYTPNTWVIKTACLRVNYVHAASTINDKGYVYGGNGGYNICDEYTPEPGLGTWTNKTDIPAPTRSNHAGSTINNKGYIYGGAYGTLKECDEYSPDTWVGKSDMPAPNRTRHTATTINDKGYVFYGLSERDCDEYTPDLNTWASKTDGPAPDRDNPSASTIGI